MKALCSKSLQACIITAFFSPHLLTAGHNQKYQLIKDCALLSTIICSATLGPIFIGKKYIEQKNARLHAELDNEKKQTARLEQAYQEMLQKRSTT